MITSVLSSLNSQLGKREVANSAHYKRKVRNKERGDNDLGERLEPVTCQMPAML